MSTSRCRVHLVLVALTVLASARQLAAETTMEAANRAFADQEWQGAADLYRRLADDEPGNALARLRLGTAMIHLGDATAALEWIGQAEKLGLPAAGVAFRKACALAALGKTAAAIDELHQAVQAGLSSVQVDGEPLLAALRTTPEFDAVRVEFDRIARPCRYDSRYRAFDFWIGEWDVRPSGAPEHTPPSENILTLEYEDCVLMEHWTSSNGGTGSSFNIFDASRNKWYQTWVDSGGGLHEYSGNPDAEGNMLFEASLAPPPGSTQRVPTRLSFFRQGPDTVRQLSESTSDGGKTWTVNYDLIYERRKQAAKTQP